MRRRADRNNNNNNNTIYIAQIRAQQQMGCRVINVQTDLNVSNDMPDNRKSFGNRQTVPHRGTVKWTEAAVAVACFRTGT